MDFLALYSKKCKSCKHLDAEESVAYDKCHYTKGNALCPAQEVQLVVSGEAQRFAKAVLRARASGNFEREVLILQKVAKRSNPFQFKFREALK